MFDVSQVPVKIAVPYLLGTYLSHSISNMMTCLTLCVNFTLFFLSHTYETLINHATALHVQGEKKAKLTRAAVKTGL